MSSLATSSSAPAGASRSVAATESDPSTGTATLKTESTNPPTPGRQTIDEALAAYAYSPGARYGGDCVGTRLRADVEAWCSELYENRGATRIYRVGPLAADVASWLLLAERFDGWHVEDAAGAGDAEDPTPPPW